MTARAKRLLAATLLMLTSTMLLSGCWDSHELDALYIVTGVALDEAASPGLMDITLQIGETKQEASGSAEANSHKNSALLLKTTSNTMMGGLIELNRDSSQKLLLHHNQVLLLGSALAEQGVRKRIDLFMRDQQARMEIPVVVVEGRAEKVLSAKLAQKKISGILIARVLDDLATVSERYRVRLLDFVSRLLDETSSPLMPIIKVVGEGDEQEIKISGMAVFKGDRMIGRLNNDEVEGYVWAMGNVKKSDIRAATGLGNAVFHIVKLDSTRDVTLRPDGGVRVALSVEATLNVGELSGFGGMTADKLMPYFVEVAEEEIRQKIMNTFAVTRRLNADIYGFGTSVHRKYPKEWKSMKARWDALFPDIELSVQVKAHIPETGQIVQSLEMKGK
jgi:spore germination protein KC